MTMITQMELIGDSKVGIADGEVDALSMCRQIARNYDKDNIDEALCWSTDVVSTDSFVKRELPMIEPFYAVKCNTDRVLVRTLAALGTGFDCASREEIDIVMDLGVSAERIVYANPCKTRSFITHAKERNVSMMTFDSAEELAKVAQLHPQAKMILRIAVSDPTARCPLNLKFGADPVKMAPQLLVHAQELGVDVIGISFHVGSGCNDPTAYREALAHARHLIELGRGLGLDMTLVDLGGGYPGTPQQTSFEDIAAVIRSAVDEYLPPEFGVRLIAEPGRFFAAAPFTLVCNIIHATEVSAEKITKRPEDVEERGFMYYVNDGVYGSFNCILFDHVQPVGTPLFDEIAQEYPSTIWGPTCDSLDKIEDQKLMRMMSVGEWIVYRNMGAYTCSASTTFNGFQRPNAIYMINRKNWARISTSPNV
uniref:ornithine decarboxylase n=1 Tax=Haemonchus contortus TaxID=6289 RepID=O76203_HAECO|nr:ornithine decarboxylase [Haemonchus contortus]